MNRKICLFMAMIIATILISSIEVISQIEKTPAQIRFEQGVCSEPISQGKLGNHQLSELPGESPALTFSNPGANFGKLQKQASGGWTMLGPEGGWILDLLQHPGDASTIYAAIQGSPSQLYISTDGGASWALHSVLPEIESILIDPSNPSIFYAVSGNSFYKSTDGGIEWTSSIYVSRWLSYTVIRISPTDSNILYIGGSYYDSGNYIMTVFKSVDAGASWTQHDVQPTNHDRNYSRCFEINTHNPQELFIGGYWYDENYDRGACLYKSPDGGQTWENKSAELGYQINDILFDPNDANKMFICNFDNVYRSTDGGDSWQRNNGWVYAYKLAIDPQNSNTLYAGYYGNIFRSTDGGLKWTYYWSGLKGSCEALLIDKTNSNKLFYGSAVGVFSSTNQGEDWASSNSGLIASRITAIDKSPSDPRTLYIEYDNDAIFKTTDSGTNWERLPEFTSCGNIGAIAVSNNSPDVAFALEESG